MSLITFFTNSFNRLFLLKNLLNSFEICNQYLNVEWVITDYGSVDGSQEFLKEYARQASFPVRLIFGNEKEYFSQLRMLEIGRRERLEAILRKFRNDAIDAAKGDYIYDVGTDHQFIRKGDWVSEIIEIFEHRKKAVGYNDLSGVIPFGYFRWRLDKPNNACCQEANSVSVPYFIAKEKAYVDYSVMQRAIREKIGKFIELTDIKPGTKEMAMWLSRDDAIRPETEYDLRSRKSGLKRAFMKYPVSVSFANDQLNKLKIGNNGLIAPLWTLEKMKDKFGKLDRPISSDELSGFLSQPPFLLSKLNSFWRKALGLVKNFRVRKKALKQLNNFNDGNYKDYIKIQLDKTLSKINKDANFRYEKIINEIGKLNLDNNSKVLCVGCRNAFELDAFEKAGFSQVEGIDLVSVDPRIKVMDMGDMEYADNSFHIIYSADSLEHSYDINQAVKEFCRVVQNNGFIAIEIPIGYKVDRIDRWDIGSLEKLLNLFNLHIKKTETIWKEVLSDRLKVIFKIIK